MSPLGCRGCRPAAGAIIPWSFAMALKMTGAEMVITRAGRPGCRAPLRLSGRRRAADLRRAVPAGEGQARARAPGGRRGACRGGLRALDRQGRRRAGHLRARRDQRRHRPHRRADGFHSRRVHHRPGADAPDRQRRLPGVRHGRHHASLHQAQLAGEERRRSVARAARGVLRRPHRPPGPRRGRRSQGRAVRHRHLHRPQGRHATRPISRASRATPTPSRARSS